MTAWTVRRRTTCAPSAIICSRLRRPTPARRTECPRIQTVSWGKGPASGSHPQLPSIPRAVSRHAGARHSSSAPSRCSARAAWVSAATSAFSTRRAAPRDLVYLTDPRSATNILGPLKSRLQREMGTSHTEFGLLLSAFSLNSTWTPLVGGILASRLGTTFTSILATGVILLGAPASPFVTRSPHPPRRANLPAVRRHLGRHPSHDARPLHLRSRREPARRRTRDNHRALLQGARARRVDGVRPHRGEGRVLCRRAHIVPAHGALRPARPVLRRDSPREPVRRREPAVRIPQQVAHRRRGRGARGARHQRGGAPPCGVQYAYVNSFKKFYFWSWNGSTYKKS